jgi:hypothetical protein
MAPYGARWMYSSSGTSDARSGARSQAMKVFLVAPTAAF